MLRFRIKNLVALAIILICLFSFLSIPNITYATSANTSYSLVLEDLQKDESFNIDDFPVVENDYSLDVIQIAESSDNELFVYVYQPKADNDILATSINISTGIEENLSYKNYTLTLIDSSSVFYKYIVNDFVVGDTLVRYYDVSSIFRKWNEAIDDDTGNDNTISEVSYSVSKLWTAYTVGDKVIYECSVTDTIEVTAKYAGFLRIANSYLFPSIGSDYTDAHFLAFSTDYEIDDLISAEVFYVESYCKYVQAHYNLGEYIEGKTYILDGPNDKYVEFNANDEGMITGDYNLWPVNYSFKRIMTVNDFLNVEDLTESAEENLTGMQWVLRFAETVYTGSLNPSFTHTYYDVSDISILKLSFITDGTVYNLGVVDNKQRGDLIPDNVYEGMPLWLFILIIVICFVLLVLFICFFSKIIKFLGWLLSAPFSIFK